MASYSAVAKFSAQDKASKVIARMERNNKRFAASSQASFAKVSRASLGLERRISGIGSQFKQMLAVVSIAGVLTVGANAVVNYDKATASLKAITGATTEQMMDYKSVIASTARDTKESSITIAKAFELVGSAKPELLASADALGEVSRQAIFMSKASGMELEESVTALTISLNQFGAGADQAAKFTDILATAQQKGSGFVSYLSEAIVRSGGTMKAFGNTFEDTVSILEGFAKAGVPAAEAGTMLSGIMSKLSKVQKKEFNPQYTKATKIIDNLAKANLSYSQLMELTDDRGAKWLTQIINQNSVVQQLTGNLNDAGNAQAQAAINTSTLSDKFKQLTASYQNAVIANAEGSTGVKMFNKVLDLLINNMDTVIGLIAGTASVMIPLIAAYKIGTLVTSAFNVAMALSAILSGKGAIALKGNTAALAAYKTITGIATAAQWAWNAAITANPIGLVIVAIAAVVGAVVMLVKHWDTIKAKFEAAPTWVKVAMMPLIMAASPILILANTIKKLIDNWDGIKAAFSKGGFLSGIKKLGGVILSALIDPLSFFLKMLAKIPGLGDKINPIINRINDFQSNAESGFGVDQEVQRPINVQREQNDQQFRVFNNNESTLNVNVNDPKERLSVSDYLGPAKIRINTSTNKF